MYYLFLRKSKDLDEYRKEFDRVKSSIESGKTPVFNEVASAKTSLIECFPLNLIAGIFSIIGALCLAKIAINEICKIAVVMIINSLCWNISNFIFTLIKHKLRICLCRRLGVEPTERNIAVMESMEYQSV